MRRRLGSVCLTWPDMSNVCKLPFPCWAPLLRRQGSRVAVVRDRPPLTAERSCCCNSAQRHLRHSWRAYNTEAVSASVDQAGLQATGLEDPSRNSYIWLDEQGRRVKQQSKQDELATIRQQWLFDSGKVAAAARPAAVVLENTPDRVEYHRRLATAAQQGQPLLAEEVLNEMVDAGLFPGARAYHGVVFAYVKGGNPAGALDVMILQYAAGIQPIPESYCVLIHAFLQADNPEYAAAVLVRMTLSGLDARPGWLMLTHGLFAKGYKEAAEQQLATGLANGWQPDAALYQHIISLLCEQERVGEAETLLNEMLDRGVTPQPHHFNPIIRAQAVGGSVEPASALIRDLRASADGNVSPDTESFNCLLEGYVVNAGSGEFEMSEALQNVRGWMDSVGVERDSRTFALFTEGFLSVYELEDAVDSFVQMLKVGNGDTSHLKDTAVAKLVLALAHGNGMPANLLLVLQGLEADGRVLPDEAMVEDEDGHTFITSWLSNRFTRLRTRLPSPHHGGEEEEQDESIREVDGVLIGSGNFVVDEDGNVVPPSKLTVQQMRAELLARGLMADGTRKDMYKRIQAARKSTPVDVIAEMKRKQAVKKATAEKKRQVQGMAKEEERKEKDRAKEANTTLIFHNGAVVKEEVIFVESADDDGTDDADDDDDDEVQETTIQTQQSAFVVGEEDAYDDGYDAQISSRLSEETIRQQKQQFYSNADAGVQTALQMLNLAEGMLGVPSIADLVMLVKAADAVNDTSAVQVLLECIRTIAGRQDMPELETIYNTCIRVCLHGSSTSFAARFLHQAQQDGVLVDAHLTAQVERLQQLEAALV